MNPRFGGLGKGLEALLPMAAEKLPDSVSAGGPAIISLEKIIANPNQPRKMFEPVALDELAATIKKNGVLQPVIVEEVEPDTYMIVAGERRMRAARLAGLNEIPAIIRKFTPEESFLASILENLQREDLNPIEEAAAFKQLMDISGLNQDGVAARVGKSRAAVANAIRLLKLPPAIQEALKTGAITPGHARALLSIEDTVSRIALFQEIIASSLSVRDTERRAASFNHGKSVDAVPAAGEESSGNSAFDEEAAVEMVPLPETHPELESGAQNKNRPAFRDPELIALEEKFITALGTKVRIEGSMENGVIKIDYYTVDDLQRLYDIVFASYE